MELLTMWCKMGWQAVNFYGVNPTIVFGAYYPDSWAFLPLKDDTTHLG